MIMGEKQILPHFFNVHVAPLIQSLTTTWLAYRNRFIQGLTNPSTKPPKNPTSGWAPSLAPRIFRGIYGFLALPVESWNERIRRRSSFRPGYATEILRKVKYWLFAREAYNGLLWSQHNCVATSSIYPKLLNNQVFYFLAQLVNFFVLRSSGGILLFATNCRKPNHLSRTCRLPCWKIASYSCTQQPPTMHRWPSPGKMVGPRSMHSRKLSISSWAVMICSLFWFFDGIVFWSCLIFTHQEKIMTPTHPARYCQRNDMVS